MNERKWVEVNAMGKHIRIDNPEDLIISFKRGTKPLIFQLRINGDEMKQLKKTFRRIGRISEEVRNAGNVAAFPIGRARR